jgi:hypothetical protein
VVRNVLLILASVALLLPPGFCVCKLPALGHWPAAADEEGTYPDQPEENGPGCECCDHREPTRSPQHESCHEHDSHHDREPAPFKEPHAPTCPAHPGWGVARAAMTTKAQTPGAASNSLTGDLHESWAQTRTVCSLAVTPNQPTIVDASLPLFVLCCAFRC